jgi:hypothetical protein
MTWIPVRPKEDPEVNLGAMKDYNPLSLDAGVDELLWETPGKVVRMNFTHVFVEGPFEQYDIPEADVIEVTFPKALFDPTMRKYIEIGDRVIHRVFKRPNETRYHTLSIDEERAETALDLNRTKWKGVISMILALLLTFFLVGVFL